MVKAGVPDIFLPCARGFNHQAVYRLVTEQLNVYSTEVQGFNHQAVYRLVTLLSWYRL